MIEEEKNKEKKEEPKEDANKKETPREEKKDEKKKDNEMKKETPKEDKRERPTDEKRQEKKKEYIKTKKTGKETSIIKKVDINPWKYLKFVHMTEKSINLVESENKLVFMVDRYSTKKEVKDAFEKAFDVKVDNVTMLIDQKGRKKAFIKLSKDYPASDIAMRLGVI